MRLKYLRPRRVLAATVAAVWMSACGGDDKPAPASAPPADAKRVDESKTGRVAGRVVFEGRVPAEPQISMPTDAVCSREIKTGTATETVVTTNGGLENVFVYIKTGLPTYYFETPREPAKVDQKGCKYLPHVFGVRVGQPIEFTNSDATAHNVHALGDANQGFNFTQPMAGMRNTRTFTAREVMVRLKCDVHPWMTAYAGVLDHPYYTVTADSGRFELKNVPAGTYSIEAWHEKLGTQAKEIVVAEKESKEIDFRFATTVP